MGILMHIKEMEFNVTAKYLFSSSSAASMWQSQYLINLTHLLRNCALLIILKLRGREDTRIHIIINCAHIL